MRGSRTEASALASVPCLTWPMPVLSSSVPRQQSAPSVIPAALQTSSGAMPAQAPCRASGKQLVLQESRMSGKGSTGQRSLLWQARGRCSQQMWRTFSLRRMSRTAKTLSMGRQALAHNLQASLITPNLLPFGYLKKGR